MDRGIAFQLTNILRDVKEDVQLGRCYLPAQQLREAGIATDDLVQWRPSDRCEAIITGWIDIARDHYERSAPLDGMIDAACRPTLWAMTTIYRELLDRIARDPAARGGGSPHSAQCAAQDLDRLEGEMDGAFRRLVAMNRQVVIIGGGLAGIAAAIRLAKDGHVPGFSRHVASLVDEPRVSTTLVPVSHSTTASTSSWDAAPTCRTSTSDSAFWIGSGGTNSFTGCARTAASIHFGPTRFRLRCTRPGPCFGCGCWTVSAKREVRRAMWRMIRMGAAGRLQWQGRTFLDFLRDQRQSDECHPPLLGHDHHQRLQPGIRPGRRRARHPGLPGGVPARSLRRRGGIPDVPLRELYDPARIDHRERRWHDRPGVLRSVHRLRGPIRRGRSSPQTARSRPRP